MLPILSLDDEQFNEIVEKARKMIPNLSPDWTDYNYHDPGITIMELLAWLKEIQQFHMDQIGPLHVKKYLMLLGEQFNGIVSAKVLISLADIKEVLTVPGGSRFYTSNIEFETLSPRFLQPVRIVKLVSAAPSETLMEGTSIQVNGGTMHFPVFGAEPQGGEALYIALSEPLITGQQHKLYFNLFDEYPVKRNPTDGAGTFVPLAEIKLEILSDGSFHPVSQWEDSTSELLENGYISFSLTEHMTAGEEGLFWLRITLLRSEYDIAPVLKWIGFNEVEASQRHTLSECLEAALEAGKEARISVDFCLASSGGCEIYIKNDCTFHRYNGPVERETREGLTEFSLSGFRPEKDEKILLICYEEAFSDSRLIGTGDGFPFQEYEPEITGLCRDGMVLLIETENGSGTFIRWEQVADFTGSKPSDRHYSYDERSGILSFGDCDRGMAPEGRILLAAGHTSLGQGGNVKAGTIRRYEGPLELGSVLNPKDAWGGADSETEADCLRRLHKRLNTIERAVTYEDYETLVKRTPGLRIENVKAIPVTKRKRQDGTMDEARVTLVVKPYTGQRVSKPSKACLDGILNMLESRRLIGSRVSILSPEYIGIKIFAEIETDAYYQQIKEEVGQVLNQYFEKQANHFGQPILYGTIYGIIDVLEHVTEVKSISLDAQGSGIQRNMNGDILLPANGLAYLKEWSCMISSAG